jgi:membrane fusion protein (multidrug efflux system)
VVQRVPVRIQLDPKDLESHPLRVGLSATVKVDTTTRDGPVLAPDVDDAAADTQVYTEDFDHANAEADAVVRRNLGVER